MVICKNFNITKFPKEHYLICDCFDNPGFLEMCANYENHISFINGLEA